MSFCRPHLKAAAGAILASLVLSGCTASPPESAAVTDVRGHLPDLRFHLTDDNGQTVDETAFRGEPTVVYFGYSGCGNQCPLTLARLAKVARAAHFRVLFVSVDPLDGPAVLHAFVSHYAPLDIHGLSGSPSAIADIARRYRAADRVPDHATALYVFDARGRARMLITPQVDDRDLVTAVREAGDV